MKILVKVPYENIEEKEISNDTFKAVQEINNIIGGYLTIDKINSKYILITNEEAEYSAKPICAYSKHFGILYGTIVFAEYNNSQISGINSIHELKELVDNNIDFVED